MNNTPPTPTGIPYRLGLTLIICFLVANCQEAPQAPYEGEGGSSIAMLQAEEAQTRLMASEGGQLVLRAIEAHGGLEAWYNAPTSAYTWEYSNTGSNMRFKTSLVADNQTRQVYHTFLTMGTHEDPQPIEGRMAWDGTDAWISPASLERPNPRFWATTGYYFESIPFVLADPGLFYTLLPPEELDGVLHDMVQVSFDDGIGDSPGDTYTLYINQETGRIDAIRYTVTYGRAPQAASEQENRPRRETLFYYEDYVTVDGLTVPTHFRGFHFIDGQKGDLKNEAWAAEISFRQPFDATQLERPADARIQPMPTN